MRFDLCAFHNQLSIQCSQDVEVARLSSRDSAAQENKLGQKFLVDTTLFCDLQKPALSDDVEDTVDYGKVYRYNVFVQRHFSCFGSPWGAQHLVWFDQCS
eukprot:jgi/Chrzof1/11278/Cz05g30110.t1